MAHFNQRWQLSQLDSRLTLDQLSHPAVNDLPAQLRPDQLELTLTAAEDQLLGWQQGLQASLSVQAKKRDQLALRWSSQLDLTPQADWQLSFSQGQLTASLTQLDRPEAQLTDLRLAANALSGQLNAKRLQLDKDAALSLQVQRLQAAALETQTGPLSLTLRDTLLHWPWNTEQRPSLSSQASLQVSQLRHPLLKTRTWQANGQLDWQQGRLQAEVKLHNSAGLTLTSQLQQSGSGAWQAEVHLEEMFFRAANPLADSLADWPELLSLSSGQLSANASLSGKPQPLQLDGQISLTGGQGIYDRSSFSGLDLPLQIRLRNQQLTLTTQALQLQQLDPGLPMGPLQIAADYRARLDAPTQGQLDLQQAELQLLGGRLWLQPGTIALDSAAQQLSLQLSGIELGRLLEVYPTEGLFGGGTLDGQLPLRLTEGAISVDKGLIQAREPGGVLQYRSERIDALAASNPGMRELAQALDDFRYTLLRSTLDYRDDGTLLLGLRLEGSNPALQQGRPVHLNIALEEDIPALLASLQLSGQVNEIIQQRVQQHLLQRQNP